MTNKYVMGIRGERIDEDKVYASCPNCAALRGEVAALQDVLRAIAGAVGEFASADGKNIVEKINFLRKDYEERIAKAEAALSRYRAAVEWATELEIMKRYDIEYGWSASDELRKRAGVG